MGYIESGKRDGARVHFGGARHGQEGYFIQPTIFTNVHPGMKIVQEEIFGPVNVVIKFEDEEGVLRLLELPRPWPQVLKNLGVDVIRQANDTVYGLAAAVFTKDITRAIRVAHRLRAGTSWVSRIPTYFFGVIPRNTLDRRAMLMLVQLTQVNCTNILLPQVPFGGYKQSGIGRELGEYALAK